jgi:D-cysteine desulfhydrase family pyridoxal phosphate-dependent enzyme
MKDIPRISFAQLPTPVEAMPNLTKELGSATFWVKRDDQTGLAFGGNKTRKLEFLIAEAQARRAKTLITAGAVQSNHCRQTAAAARRFGMSCILVLTGEPVERVSGNFYLDHLLGAEIVWSSHDRRESDLQVTLEKADQDGRHPFLIPYGGSNHTGVAGYVHAMEEMVGQGIDPDWIVFPTSSGGTQAGMVLGSRVFGYQGKILGISVDKRKEVLVPWVQELIEDTAAYLGVEHTGNQEHILVNDDFIGEGYGMMGEPEIEAIQMFARNEGLFIDPVYTGRAAAGMISLARAGYFGRDEKVLFWHTGGTPGLFAERYLEGLAKTF